jgi:hypothetical protein
MSNDMSMIMSLSFARPITLAMRNATPVPMIPKSHRLQKSVSVHSVSRLMKNADLGFRIRIGAETPEAVSNGCERTLSQKTRNSLAD